jgi:heat-inducible transcriptional repressor
MLDDRKSAILSAVVQEYISTGQPVGSASVSREPAVRVSSATVRSELSVLEQDGYLVQPHTSAGRIPTDKGYRYFVDNLARPGRLDETSRRQVGEFFSAAHGRLEEMLHQTSNLLAELTHSAAVVVGPRSAAIPVRRVQFVGLSEGSATVVVVFANGSVENVAIDLEPGDDEECLAAASIFLSTLLDGHVLADAGQVIDSGDRAVDRLCRTALARMHEVSGADHVYTGGVSEVARAFDAVDVVRSVLHTLEQQFVVVSLVSDIVNRGMSVAIGVEHGIEPLSACSVVVSRVVVDGEHVGSVGVLGPTRMNYPQALATVDVVSEHLGQRIEEG